MTWPRARGLCKHSTLHSHLQYPDANLVPVSIGISGVIKLWVQFPPEDINRHPEVVSQHVVEPEGGDEEDVARLQLNLVPLGFEKPVNVGLKNLLT